MDEEHLEVVASAILVLMTRAHDWDANIPSMAAQAADVVSAVETWPRIKREREREREREVNK